MNTAAIAIVFVLPVKLALELLGHFAELGKLSFDDDEARDPSVPLKGE